MTVKKRPRVGRMGLDRGRQLILATVLAIVALVLLVYYYGAG